MQRLWGPRDVRIQGRQLAGQGIDQAPKQLQHQQGKLPELNDVITDIPGLRQGDGFEALPISLAHGLRAGG